MLKTILLGLVAVMTTLQPAKERKPAPAFRLADAAGKLTGLEDFRGRVILLNFWATECGACEQELPYFMEFDRVYRPRGLQMVGVSMEILYHDLKGPSEAWARVSPFVKERGIRYPVLMGDDKVTEAYLIEALPVSYLIDKKGRVAAKYIGLAGRADVEANLKRLLAEP
ncbi:MAG: TlpA family protein disulfide reductase [Bryobacteraceae bacterium]|nr:TlpA family protein disulfide reductase [Bryobacteraceae bacterium]